MSVDKKLDEIKEDISEIKTHLAVYNEQLKIHIKRTTHLEERVKPIEKHVIAVNSFFKIVLAIAGFGASVATVLALLK